MRKIAAVLLIVLGAGLPACRTPAPPAAAAPAAVLAGAPAQAHPWRVVPGRSLLTIRAWRGGPLARFGHNHVIASHDLEGDIQLADERARSTFELRIPVAGLTVDEGALRALEGADFAAPVPGEARAGTRHNMLGEALLDAARFPDIGLKSVRLVPLAGGYQLTLEVTVKERPHKIELPVQVAESGAELVVSGETELTQSSLGLEPFSIMLGALQVEDRLRVRFRIVAQPAVSDKARG